MKTTKIITVAIFTLIVIFSAYAISKPAELKSILFILVLPLVIPIKGTLNSSRYTIGYSSLLAICYFSISSTIFVFDNYSILMLFAIVVSILWFISCLIYNKTTNHNQ